MDKEKLFKSRNKLILLILLFAICEFIQFIATLDNGYNSIPLLNTIAKIIMLITVIYTAICVTNIIIYLEKIDNKNKAE